MTQEARIGLVLGAGGSPGGVFIRAALAAIEDRTGFVAAMSWTVIGTSAGALNAAQIDSDPVEASGEVVQRLATLAARTPPPALGAVDRMIAGPRQILGRAVGRLVPAGTNPPDYPVAAGPYHQAVRTVSCRRSDGSRRIANLSRAVAPAAELYASAAIPGFAPPVVLDGVEHVDGAVWSTTNADLVSPDDHDALIVIAPMASRSGGGVLPRSHRAAVVSELAPWNRVGKPAVFIAPSAHAIERRDDHDAFAADARARVLG